MDENMAELKLRQLYRGFVLTDFDGNDVGCKDSEHAIEEIRKILGSDNDCSHDNDHNSSHDHVCKIIGKPIQRMIYNPVELRRNIFEKAKEQIDIIGKINGAQISRDLDVKCSTVHSHLKKMSVELDALIKSRQEERDKKMSDIETRTGGDV